MLADPRRRGTLHGGCDNVPPNLATMTLSQNKRHILRIFLTVVWALQLSRVHAQNVTKSANEGADEAAQALFEQATAALDRGQPRRALGLYEDAYSSSPRARLLYNIGIAAERDGQPGRALAAYIAYLKSAPDVEKRDTAEASIDRLRRGKPNVSTTRPPVECRDLMDEARRARGRGDFEGAWRLYKRADELFPTARTLLGLGSAELNLKRYPVSFLHLDAATRTSSDALDGNLLAEAERLKALILQSVTAPTVSPAASKPPENDEVASALVLYQRACDGGSFDGCTSLGVNYSVGRGVRQDHERARELFAIACDGGDSRGCSNLGVAYEHGLGVTKDYGRAYFFYKKACDGKNAMGCVNLAGLYDAGLGVTKDYAKATSLYSIGCDLGDLVSCAELGRMFENGRGVETDYKRAVELYKRSCQADVMYGCAKLGYAYGAGHGLPQDFARAATLSAKACEGGHMLGCFNLGMFREFGRGVEKDLTQALELYTRACNGGFVASCTNAGNLRMQMAESARATRVP